jgi:hypothetical protein
LGRVVTPGKQFVLHAAAGSAFPFRLSGKAAFPSCSATQPLAVKDGIDPGNGNHGLGGIRELRIVPHRWRRNAAGIEKERVVSIRHLALGEVKGVDPNPVRRALVILARSRTHPKPSGRNQHPARRAGTLGGICLAENCHLPDPEPSIGRNREELTVKKLEFEVKLDGAEGTEGAALTPPFDIQEVFKTRGRVPVRGTINGFPFRSSLMPMGGSHRMVVNKTIRDGAGVKAGDTVSVQMERDEAERVVEVPLPLRKALARSRAAQANWAKLSCTHRKEIARSITEAKKEETRARRLEKAIDILKTGKKWTG